MRTVALAGVGARRVAATVEAPPGVLGVSEGVRRGFAAATTENPEELADLRASPERLTPLLARSGGDAHLFGPGHRSCVW